MSDKSNDSMESSCASLNTGYQSDAIKEEYAEYLSKGKTAPSASPTNKKQAMPSQSVKIDTDGIAVIIEKMVGEYLNNKTDEMKNDRLMKRYRWKMLQAELMRIKADIRAKINKGVGEDVINESITEMHAVKARMLEAGEEYNNTRASLLDRCADILNSPVECKDRKKLLACIEKIDHK